MEIDWSKAPEGATHYRKDGYCSSTGGVQYYKLDRAGWRYWVETIGHGWKECSQPCNGFLEIPAKHATSWTGEGLPPAGEWCEILSVPEPAGAWCKGKILYISKSSCVWCWDEKQIDMCANTFEMEFRPIRTPEQIAAEERKAGIELFIEDMRKVNGCGFTSRAEDLWDMSYRKQAKP